MERISSHYSKGDFKMGIRTLLNEEIKNEFNDLKKMELGSETYKTTVDGLTKLVDRAIELERIDIEQNENYENRQVELSKIEDDRKDQFVRNVLTGAGIIIPTAVTIWGTIKSINFEKEGTITTIMGRGFIQKLLPKK